MARGPRDLHASRRCCCVDIVIGVAVFELETEARSPFEPGGCIEAGGIVELDFATWRGALIFQLVHIAPAGAQPEIPTVRGRSLCDQSDERHPRKGYGAEFHIDYPHFEISMCEQRCVANLQLALGCIKRNKPSSGRHPK